MTAGLFIVVSAFAVGGKNGQNNNGHQLYSHSSQVNTNQMQAKLDNFNSKVFKGNASKVPPVNDDICSAIELIPGAAPTVGDNSEATVAPGEPLPACWFDAALDSTVWFYFVGTVSGVYNVTTDLAVLTNDDTQLGIYTSSNGTCTGTLTEIGCNDDVSGANFLSCAGQLSLTLPLLSLITS